MGFGLKFVVFIFILVWYLLDCWLLEDGVVVDEWGDIIVGDSVLNGRVDEVGEECDVVFEVCVYDLYNVGWELYDINVWRLFYFGNSI